MATFFKRLLTLLEYNLPWLSLLSFVLGILIASHSTPFAYSINQFVTAFIDSYTYIAPIAIYLILTPTLLKLLADENRGKRFATYTILWFANARLLACFYAIIFTTVVFDLPFQTGSADFYQALTDAFYSLIWMLTHNIYFYAVYASLITIIIALRFKRLTHFLAHGIDVIEYLGAFIVPLVPLIMLAVGAYVTILPEVIQQTIGPELATLSFDTVHLLGLALDPSDSTGMLLIYIIGALLTGIACACWHLALIGLAKLKMPSFSLKSYFFDYLIKVYPLLWATSSEALATPLNLRMVKKFCPDIPDEVRQFVVGTGSFLNINGTIINVFLMTGIVAAILGIPLSFLQLLLSIPIVFLIGYGVPGIPGELLLFGGPMAICIGVSPELTPIFLSLYIGLQIGLPDSFRTASNSTDECLCAIILNKNY